MEGYFLVVDILGFKKLIKNLSHKELICRIDSWVSLVNKEMQSFTKCRYQLLSDTLFIGSDNTEDGLKSLITLSKSLLLKGLANKIPIRGAITFGKYEWGSLIYGEAVVEAYSLEQQQDWIGISCANHLPHIESFWGIDGVICYPAPVKEDPIQLRPVVDWEVPKFDTLCKQTLGSGLTDEHESLTWSWGVKITRTTEFRIYRNIIQNKQMPAEKFQGYLPIQIIESSFD
jgi:hypothetical protein